MKHWLKNRYEGYLHKHDMREDNEITQVGPGTLGGEYLLRSQNSFPQQP